MIRDRLRKVILPKCVRRKNELEFRKITSPKKLELLGIVVETTFKRYGESVYKKVDEIIAWETQAVIVKQLLWCNA